MPASWRSAQNCISLKSDEQFSASYTARECHRSLTAVGAHPRKAQNPRTLRRRQSQSIAALQPYIEIYAPFMRDVVVARRRYDYPTHETRGGFMRGERPASLMMPPTTRTTLPRTSHNTANQRWSAHCRRQRALRSLPRSTLAGRTRTWLLQPS